MKRRRVEVLVVGGGPAGSTAATLLARRGRTVLVCERERFPRFHIGESLLPYNVPLLRRLGVWERLRANGFQPKFGARFLFEPGIGSARLDFLESLDRHLPMALHVRRAEFDRILLDNARRAGAEVLEGCAVERVRFDGDRATGARVIDADEGVVEVRADLVLDATGRDTLLGRQLRLVDRDPVLRQAALYAHFEGADLGLGREGGDLLITGGNYGWIWMIPLDGQTASVGCVFPGSVLRRHCQTGGGPDALLNGLLAASPEVSRRLAGARQVMPAEPAADFSYRCRRLCGDGWAVLGDAAGFLDPVFSSGVLLAMCGAERAADVAGRRLGARRRRPIERRHLLPYERFARRSLDAFRQLIQAFYDPAGIQVLVEAPPRLLRRALISAFAGKVGRRDPRVWLACRLLLARAARLRREAERGVRTLPPAPAV